MLVMSERRGPNQGALKNVGAVLNRALRVVDGSDAVEALLKIRSRVESRPLVV